MDCFLHGVELHYNCIGEIQPYQVVFLRWVIHPYRHIQRLFCTAPSGHWFLEGWIGDHSVEFLVDSGSSVTAMSDVFHRKDAAQREWNWH